MSSRSDQPFKVCEAEVIAFPGRFAEVRKKDGRVFLTDIVWYGEEFREIKHG